MNTAAAVSSMEARLRALEQVLRGNGAEDAVQPQPGPASRRLHALEAQLEATLAKLPPDETGSTTTTTTAAAMQQVWQETDQLMMELDPGTALSHQQQIAAPILYRRQQVLACHDMLQQNMAAVHNILTLLAVGQAQMISSSSSSSSSNEPLVDMQVTKAPILSQTVPPAAADQERVVAVERTLAECQQSLDRMAARMDRLVSAHHALVTAGSEKMVLAHEAANK